MSKAPTAQSVNMNTGINAYLAIASSHNISTTYSLDMPISARERYTGSKKYLLRFNYSSRAKVEKNFPCTVICCERPLRVNSSLSEVNT